MVGMNKNDTNLYTTFYIVLNRKPAGYYIENSFELSYKRRYEERTEEEAIELM